MSSGIIARLPTIAEIRQRTQLVLKRLPCLWQAEVCREQLKGEKDVLCIAPTGLGKTLTFWMPLLFREDGIQIVVTPLNLLGTQNVVELDSYGLRACEVTAETATPKLFQEIEDGVYRVIIVNPEELMKDGGGFEKLLKKERFTSRIISMIWDEAHCISTWNSFRADYKNTHRIRYVLPKLRFLLASATFNSEIKNDVFKLMHISPSNCAIFQRSNDRPNVHIEVRPIKHALNSYEDLDFVIPPNWKSGDDLPRFLIFFDNIEHSIAAAERLRSRMDGCTRHKFVWFNSRMTSAFREDCLHSFQQGDLLGFFSTDSFGMGINIKNIELVIQWRVTDLNTLWQRFGRAVRDLIRNGVVIFLVEGKYFDEEKQKAAERAEKAKETRKRKAAGTLPGSPRRAKVARLTNAVNTADLASSSESAALTSSGPSGDGATESHTSPTRRGNSPLGDTNGRAVATRNLDDMRAEFKAERKPQAQIQKKRTGDDLITPEMDALINAGTRPSCGCYRIPIMAFYANDKTVSDHLQCRPDLPSGCERCAAMPSKICCALCSPDDPLFAKYRPIAPLPAASAGASSRASRLPKESNQSTAMVSAKRDLTTALDNFRVSRAEAEYGPAAHSLRAENLVMPEQVLGRLVECASVKKIGSVGDIKRETKWPASKVDKYGGPVLEILLRHFPLAFPVTSTPLANRTIASGGSGNSTTASQAATSGAGVSPAAGTTGRIAQPRKCSACKQPGHNRNSKKCPQYSARCITVRSPPRQAAAEENRPVSASVGSPSMAPASRPLPVSEPLGSLSSLFFESPSYRQNVRVLTIDQIVAMRAVNVAAETSSDVPQPSIAPQPMMLAEPSSGQSLMSPVPASRFYGNM